MSSGGDGSHARETQNSATSRGSQEKVPSSSSVVHDSHVHPLLCARVSDRPDSWCVRSQGSSAWSARRVDTRVRDLGSGNSGRSRAGTPDHQRRALLFRLLLRSLCAADSENQTLHQDDAVPVSRSVSSSRRPRLWPHTSMSPKSMSQPLPGPATAIPESHVADDEDDSNGQRESVPVPSARQRG